MTFCSSVTIHLSGSIYVNIDSMINDQEASLRYALILKFPWNICVTIYIRAQLLSIERFLFMNKNRLLFHLNVSNY